MHENCKSHHSPRWWKLPNCSSSRDSCSTAGPYGSPCSASCSGKWTISPRRFPRSESSLVLSRQLRAPAEASTLLHASFVHVSAGISKLNQGKYRGQGMELCLLLKGKVYHHRLRGRLPRSQRTSPLLAHSELQAGTDLQGSYCLPLI